MFAIGGYQSDFTFQGYRQIFEDNVYYRLDGLLESLKEKKKEAREENEPQVAAEIHRDTVMVHFYEHAACGQANNFVSHTTCFSCLMHPPEHPLPCGHVLCTPCLCAFGRMDGSRYNIVIDGCPIESRLRPSLYGPWRMVLKPKSAGVRILSLDG